NAVIGQEIATFELGAPIYGVAFDTIIPQRLRVSTREGVALLHPDPGSEPVLSILENSSHGWATNFAVDGGGQIMVSGGEDKIIKMWDIRQNRLLRTLEGHTDAVVCLDFMPNAKVFASKGRAEDSTVRLWSTETGAELRKLLEPSCDAWMPSL